MNRRPNIGKIVYAVLLLGTIILALTGYRAFQGNLEALDNSNQEPIDWSALQLEIEVLKFQAELGSFALEKPGTSPESVNNRFDILWSRIALFQKGKVGARLAEYPSTAVAIEELFAEMLNQEARIVELKTGDTATAQELFTLFSSYTNDIRLMARAVYLGELEVDGNMREEMRVGAYVAAYASLAFCLLSLLALIYINRESLRFQTLATANRALAEEADAANTAKSKFLAMMSHELRTPMNGVLGTLSLARQGNLPPAQQRLLERAERSGKQMTMMLSDILDFSALQDDELQLEQKPFETQDLAQAIEELFDPIAQRENIHFSMQKSENCPTRVIGDFKRIRQSLSHLTAYIVETAGTKNVNILLDHDQNQLRASIAFNYSSIGGTWQPDLILGTQERSEDQFASDALGPSVARALVERMDGSIRLDTPDDDSICIIVSVRAKAIDIKELNVRLDVSSSALQAVCKAALSMQNVAFLEAEDTREPHVVLTDCGNEHSDNRALDLAKQYPQAMLISVGEPIQPDLFDNWIAMPIDVDDFRVKVVERLVG